MSDSRISRATLSAVVIWKTFWRAVAMNIVIEIVKNSSAKVVVFPTPVLKSSIALESSFGRTRLRPLLTSVNTMITRIYFQ